MQYQLILPQKGKTRQSERDYQKRNAELSGFVHHDPAAQIMGTDSRSRSTARKKFVRTSICQGCCGNDNVRGPDRQWQEKTSKLGIFVYALRKKVVSPSIWTFFFKEGTETT